MKREYIKELVSEFSDSIIIIPNKMEEIKENKDRIKVPLHLCGNINTLSKANDNERIIAGYASIIEIDSENQIIPKATLEEGIQSLLEESDYANLMITHQNIQIGKILNEWNNYKTHVDDKGLFIVASIRKNLDIANEIWNRILDNKINGFSIAAEVLLAHDECDDKACYTVIDKMNMFEVSVCEKPVNVKSGFIVLSKSEDCNICNLEKEMSMSKKIKKEETPEPSEEVIEEKAEEVEETPQEEKSEEPSEEEKSEPEEEETTEEKSEEEKPDIMEIVNGLTREIESLKGIVEQMSKQEEMPEEEEEEEPMPEEKSEDSEECTECEEKSEEVEKSYVTKDELSEVKQSLDKILDQLKTDDEVSKSLKAKDDEISELTKRIEVLEKAEKPKTIVKEEPEEPKKEEPKYTPTIVHDKLRPGTIYKELD